jgi:hypothetical protein
MRTLIAVMLIGTLCAAGACEGPGSPIEPRIPQEGGGGGAGGGTAAGVLAFLVQPNNVAAGSPINPEVKVGALALGNVLTAFSGTVRVAFGSNPSGGTLSGTVGVAALSGVAFFDTLVINQPGSGYTLVASAPGMVSVTSAPFTVFGRTASAARAP